MAIRAHTVPKFYLGGFVSSEPHDGSDPFVWLGSLATGEVKRRAPKNISTVRGFYDGPGGLADTSQTMEAHLSGVEAEAASAIRAYVASPHGEGMNPPPAIWRFLAWQAARTPGWMETLQRAVDSSHPDDIVDVVEPPPEGFAEMADRPRSHWIEHRNTRERRLIDSSELDGLRRQGWRWVLSKDDCLEMMHLQAWYFQVRHFPRLNWIRLEPPLGEHFITSDRAVTWHADGILDPSPAALRHPSAELVAPLTSRVLLLGRNHTARGEIPSRDVNRLIACTASNWIAGPTRSVVEVAISDRRAVL
jgi:hypothetical protein